MMTGTSAGTFVSLAQPARATSIVKTALINGDSIMLGDAITDSGGNRISLEEFAAEQAGYAVTVVSGAEWDAMTAADFAQYQVLIIGDPDCSSTPASATSNAATWAPVVMGTSGQNNLVGNRVVVGTDPEYHYDNGRGNAPPSTAGDPTTSGAEHLVQDGITYAGGVDGATGAYFDTSCRDDLGSDATVLNSLSVAGAGFTTGASGACGNNVQLIASNPVFSTLTDSDIQGWSCSSHFSFPTYPTDWQPLAVAADAPTQPTCGTDPFTNTTACGEAYVLVAGNGIVVSAPDLSLAPPTGSDAAGGQHTVTATATQGGAPLSGQLVSFDVTGQNSGASGTCIPANCTTDASGNVTFTYSDGSGAGTDTIDAAATIGGSTEHASATETWTAPATTTLTVSRTGSGTGSVTSSPGAINCGLTCSDDFTPGTVVTLTANVASGSVFGGWSGACTGTGSCQVTIGTTPPTVTADFDPAPVLSIANTSVTEPDTGNRNAVFTVTSSRAISTDITFDANTLAGGTAIPTPNAHADYAATSLIGLTIPAGQTSATFVVPVIGDLVHEPNETFMAHISSSAATIGTANATATIVDNDPVPNLVISDTSVTEGDSGTTPALVTVSVNGTTNQSAITVHYQTHDGTATVADHDYVAATGTLTIPPYATTGPITVLVNGDKKIEGDETFTVTLTSPTGAALQTSTGTVTILDDETVTVTAAGGPHTCTSLSDGRAECWGANNAGQLGDNTLTTRTTPVLVENTTGTGPLTGIKQIVAGGQHTCALMTDTTVECWGLDDFGQLGNGVMKDSKLPIVVKNSTGKAALSGVLALAGRGGYFTCALITGGQVDCWGSNAFGQLGDGTFTTRPLPVAVKTSATTVLTGVTQIVDGGYHTCARLSNGTAACWGKNQYGEVGDGTLIGRTHATTVQKDATGAPLTGITQLAGGGFHTCALLTYKIVECWGYNNDGQLGDGTTTQRPRPVLVGGTTPLIGVSQVVTGAYHTCALIGADGSVQCWGSNSNGQLGVNSTTEHNLPVAVFGTAGPGHVLTGAAQLAAGSLHTCALLTDDTIVCWGWNAWGQLGDGTHSDRHIPVLVHK